MMQQQNGHILSPELRSLDELRPDAVAYSATMSACEKAWQWQQVLMLLTDTWKIRVGWGSFGGDKAIEDTPRLMFWSSHLTMCGSGRFKSSSDTLEVVSQRMPKKDHYSEIIEIRWSSIVVLR